MDVIYDNLENFTEEATNAELREENKNLKIKLEEYATALEQLQKEFDTLLVEHKKLELNYSSLLRTAKSEIERKTQTITKLNIEKDELVLNSIQNRNTLYNRRKPTNDPKNREGPVFRNASQVQYNVDNRTKPSLLTQVQNERRDQNYDMSADFNNLQRNMRTRHLDIVNKSVVNPNINISRKNEVKENVVVKDEHKPGARITCRRKSMPVLGMDSQFSDEDEVASSGSSKGLVPKEQPENRYPDRFHSDRPSMEHKVFVHHEYKTETRSRHIKHDQFKQRNRDNHEQYQRYKRNQSSDRRRRSQDRKKASPERRRVSPERRRVSPERRRVSPERRRPSPERRKASQDRSRKDGDYSMDVYKRQEYDRHKRSASPPKDKYHDYKYRSRDSTQFNERNPQLEFEKYKSRDQDKYTTKHKMMHDYEEPSSKRMRVDTYPKHEDDRWVEKQAPASLEIEPLHMSCQSPDQSHFEAHSSHQTREIKLTASINLEDPRLVSKKYALETHDGISKLATVDSAIIDVKVIDKSAWEVIETVKMPDALPTKPTAPDLTSVPSLQKPMNSGKSTLRKPTLCDTSDTSLLKPKSSEMQQDFIQKPTISSLSDSVSSETPGTLPQKSPKTPDNQKKLLADSKSTHESKSSDMPDILTQKPLTGDESIPDASAQKTAYMSNDELVKEIYMDIENINMETASDVNDFDDVFNNSGEKTIEKKPQEFSRKDEIELPNAETVSKKPSNSKTLKNSIISSGESNSQEPIPKLKNKNTDSKTTDKTVRKSSEDLKFNASKLPPKRRSSDFRYLSATEIIAGDLELSDDNSDNTDMPIIKQKPISKNKQDMEMKDSLHTIENDKSKTFELKIDFDEASSKKVVNKNVGEKTDDIMLDIRKSKAKKKSLKLKETNPCENKDTPISTNKPVKKAEAPKELCENADISLSMDQLVKIKENITKELAEKVIPLDKPIKNKDNKLKAPPKSKEAAVAIDKTVKKKEMQPKVLTEIKDTVPSMDKPGHGKKKDKKPKELPEKKKTTTEDKPQKKKDIKTKESVESISAIPIDKTAKNNCNIQESSSKKGKETINKEVEKKNDEFKKKDNKFNELFGDSSSLVSPEDLGIVPAAVAPPDNYIAMFEDAQDALDMNSIRDTVTATTKNTNSTEVKAQSFSMNSEKKTPIQPAYQMQPAHAEPVSNSSTNPTMYQNLQPGFSQDENTVNTVIISSGIQPQCTLDATETYPMSDTRETDLHVMQCVKPTVLQDIALQALATSTPQKIWHQTVQAVESILETRCESREGSITENSSTSTNVAQTNVNDEPDVTIFVKRRRKVLRKK